MNIPKSVYDFGMEHGLDSMATGGGFDYLYKPMEGGMMAVIRSGEDAGSPEDLDEQTDIMIYLNYEWEEFVSVPFPSARAAIEAAAGIYENVEPEEGIIYGDEEG